MVVFGDLRFDFRVYREAQALAATGSRISIVASDFASEALPSAWSAFDLHLIPIDRDRSLRWSYPLFWYLASRLATRTFHD